jgi:hypothetical protein
MTDTLIDPVGPEGRNEEAAAFEDQLVETGNSLGWKPVCRNIDLYVDKRVESRGVDVLWAITNPRDDTVEGWIGEAKRKRNETTFRASKLKSEVLELRKKIAKFDRATFYGHPSIQRAGISRLVGGVVAISGSGLDDEKIYGALEEMEFSHNEEGLRPTKVVLLAPSTLNGLADAIRRVRTMPDSMPAQFYWPATAERLEGIWASACPPQQLAAGLVAFDQDGRIVLWVRDGLTHHEVEAYVEIARGWRLGFDIVAFTDLTQENLRTVQDGWKHAAEQLNNAGGVARLPERPLGLHTSNESMKEYEAVWPRVAA